MALPKHSPSSSGLPVPPTPENGNNDAENKNNSEHDDGHEDGGLPGLPDLPTQKPRRTKPKTQGLPTPQAPKRSTQQKARKNKRSVEDDGFIDKSHIEPEHDNEPVEDKHDENWVVDRRTGVKHRIMPKSEYDEDGRPKLLIEDFDVDDLNSEADTFLAHLQVGPSKQDVLKARDDRKKRLRKK